MMLKKWGMVLAAASLLAMPAYAGEDSTEAAFTPGEYEELPEGLESAPASSVRVEDGILTISIEEDPDEREGFAWELYRGDKGDATLTECITDTTEEEGLAYVGSFRAAPGTEEGEDYIRIVHTNGKYVDEYMDFNVVIEDGEIKENNSGSHTLPTYAEDLAAVLGGTWQDTADPNTFLEIGVGEDGGLDMVISGAGGKDGMISYYTLTAYFDALQDALVYENGAEHTAAISGETETEADTDESEGSERGVLLIEAGDDDADITLRLVDRSGERDIRSFVKAD